MRKDQKIIFFTTLICATVFVTSGCDMFNSMKDSFKGSDKDEPSSVNKVVQPKSSESVKKDVALPANVLARVGNWTITVNEYNERLKALKEVVPDYDTENFDAKRLVLEELVRQQLLVADAEQSGVDKKKDVVAAIDEFRRTILVREMAQSITGSIDVTEEEARAFYEEQKKSLIEPIQWHVSEIVVSSQLKASELLTEILKGASFTETAKMHSTSDSASQGGNLGVLSEQPFPAMAEAMLSLSEGEVSSPFKGPNGYYLIRLDKKTGGSPIAYEDIKEDIIQNRTVYKQQQAILQHIEQLKERMPVEIREDLLK